MLAISGSSIENGTMLNPEEIRPTVLDVTYRDVVSFLALKDGGRGWIDDTLAAHDGVDVAIEVLNFHFGSDLALLRHFKVAEITLRHHPSLGTPSMQGVLGHGHTDRVNSQPIRSAPNEYAVGFSQNTGIILASAKDILADGELTGFMRGWMRLLAHTNYWTDEINQFLPLYPGSPESNYALVDAEQAQE